MAVQTGQKAEYSDLINWYQIFNTFISNYGGPNAAELEEDANATGISQLTVPRSGAKIQATDVTNLTAKIEEFKTDTYLKTEPDLWVSDSEAAVGIPIRPIAITSGISTTITNMEQVVCRNRAVNSYGAKGNEYCQNQSKSCGTHSVTEGDPSCAQITNSSGSCSNYYKEVTCDYLYHGSGAHGNGSHDKTCTCGYKSNTVRYCGLKTNTCSSGTKTYGGLSNAADTHTNSSGTNSPKACSYGYKGNTYRSCGTNSSGANSSACQYGEKTSGTKENVHHDNMCKFTCGSGTNQVCDKTMVCTQYTYSSACPNGKYPNVQKTNGHNLNCGYTINIKCSQSSVTVDANKKI